MAPYVIVNVSRRELHGGANYATFDTAAEASERMTDVVRRQGASRDPDVLVVAELGVPDQWRSYQNVFLSNVAVKASAPWWRPFRRRWIAEVAHDVRFQLDTAALQLRTVREFFLKRERGEE